MFFRVAKRPKRLNSLSAHSDAAETDSKSCNKDTNEDVTAEICKSVEQQSSKALKVKLRVVRKSAACQQPVAVAETTNT
jgi:hypothetical protein